MKTIFISFLLSVLFSSSWVQAEGSNATSQLDNLASVASTTSSFWQANAPMGNQPPRAELSLWRSFTSLLVVLALLLGTTWFLKKRVSRFSGSSKAKRLEVIQRLTLGNHQHVAILRVDGQDLVVGITPNQITALGQTQETGDSSSVPATTSFSQLLAKVTSRQAAPPLS